MGQGASFRKYPQSLLTGLQVDFLLRYKVRAFKLQTHCESLWLLLKHCSKGIKGVFRKPKRTLCFILWGR